MNRHPPVLAASIGLLLTACGGLSDRPAINLGLGTPLNQSQPGAIHLKADVRGDSDITQVAFWQGTRSLGVDTTAPYEMTDQQNASGTYRYRAVATDAAGAQAEALLDITLQIPTGIQSVTGKVVEFANLTTSGLTTRAWTGGAGKLTAALPSSPVAETTLNADGSFNLSLPATVTTAHLAALGTSNLGLPECSTPPNISNAGVLGAVAKVSVTATKTGSALPLTYTVTTANGTPKEWTTKVGSLVYVDRPVSITGSATCKLSGTLNASVNFMVSLVPGWNKVTIGSEVNTTGSVSGMVTSGDLPSNNWVYAPGVTLP